MRRLMLLFAVLPSPVACRSRERVVETPPESSASPRPTSGEELQVGLPPPGPADSAKTNAALACRRVDSLVGEEEFARRHAVCEKACAEDDMPSCGLVAGDLTTGLGVGGKRDYVRAVQLYDRACASGGASLACYFLGDLLDKGQGIPRDSARAERAWRAGCRQGDRMSCEALEGIRYEPKLVLSLTFDGGSD